MNIFRLYGRVLALLGSESRLAWALALANMALASAQFAEPVLLGRIIDTLTGAQTRGEPPSWSQLERAACRLGRLRAFHHRLRHADRSLRRPPRASPPPRRADRLFRARAAASAHLSRQHPFRPADEGDAAGHRRTVGAVGRVLPRSPLVVHLAARPAADLALYQLAARFAADRAVRRFRRRSPR